MKRWLAILAATIFLGVPVYAQQISGVTVSNILQDSATVNWTTDEATDAQINYGLDPNDGLVRDPDFTKKDHVLVIPDLQPATTYYFRAVSTDAAGNRNATTGFVFTTLGSPADKIKKEIKKITDPEQLKQLQQAVQDQAQAVLNPPSIIGLPNVEADSTSATITWTTDREAGSAVSLEPDATFNKNSAHPYTITQGNSTEQVVSHKVTVTGLQPSTMYHFQVTSTDQYSLTGASVDDTFKTKSILPQIQHVKVDRIQEDSAWISWDTGNVLAKGTVEYKNNRTKISRSAGDPIFAAKHSVQLTGLVFGTRYSAVITSTNQGGDQVISTPFSFLTVRDVIPPTISKVKNESTLYPGDDVKVQTIVTWQTDEPSNCQVFYTQGLGGPGSTEQSLNKESNPLTDHTTVIVGFAPGTVYKYWVVCDDVANNESRSEDFVLITPIKEKSIIDIILQNFQGTFGWVNKVGH